VRRGEPEGERTRFPVPVYLIETDEQRILVDTGLNPAAVAEPAGFYGKAEAMSPSDSSRSAPSPSRSTSTPPAWTTGRDA
jgi:hypothetical protein